MVFNMVQVDFDPREHIDRIGYMNFKGIAKLLPQDKDWVNIVVGPERSSKSVDSHVLCAIVDPTFCVKRVTFPTAEFRKEVMRAKRYTAVSQDEGAETWMSLDANSIESKRMVRLFMEVGERNLFINIVIPDFRYLNKYLKGHRANSLIHVTSRGKYDFYSKSRLQQIRIDANTRTVIWAKPNFSGWIRQFPKKEFWKEYVAKKRGFTGSKDKDPKMLALQEKTEKFYKTSMTLREAAITLGMNPSTFATWSATGQLKKRWGVKAIDTMKGYRLRNKDVKLIYMKAYGHTLDGIVD